MRFFSPARFYLILLFFEIVYMAISLYRAPRWDAFLIGDCPYYAATAESLLRDGDWDLRNQLPGDLKDHEGFFALSKDNRIVSKHSVLLPIVSIPFLFQFGKAGLLIVSIVQTFALIVGIAVLAGDTPKSRLLALVAYLSTPFLQYTFNYSPDVLSTALAVWAFIFAIRHQPIRCGLLAGLAVWAKVYLALILLPLAILVLPLGWRATLRCVVASLIAVAPMLAINAHLFGSPFTTGYDRDARVMPEGFAITEHYSRFNQPILTGLGNLLFDGRIGLMRTAPLWFLWPFGLFKAWRTNARWASLALAWSILLNLLFFARYDEWDASAFGNRFLFPAIAFGFALLAPILAFMDRTPSRS
ncbi:MAG: hypothetical protein K8T89_23845 [Planctomycetes bacterium]|nr:hypothetical protein [Planctomycetota bacterium]